MCVSASTEKVTFISAHLIGSAAAECRGDFEDGSYHAPLVYFLFEDVTAHADIFSYFSQFRVLKKGTLTIAFLFNWLAGKRVV